MAWISSVYLYYKASRQLTMRNTSPFLNHLYLASLSSQHQNHQVRNIRTKSLSHHQRKKVVSRVPRFFFAMDRWDQDSSHFSEKPECFMELRAGLSPAATLELRWVYCYVATFGGNSKRVWEKIGCFFFGHSHLRSSGWFDVRLMCEGISKQVHLKDWSHFNHWSSWRCSLDSIREWSR